VSILDFPNKEVATLQEYLTETRREDVSAFWKVPGKQVGFDILEGEAIQLRGGKHGISSEVGYCDGLLYLRNGDGNELSFELDEGSASIICRMKVEGRSSDDEFLDHETPFMSEAIKSKAALYVRELRASLGAASLTSGECLALSGREGKPAA
jgi:hypothetical protein